MQLKHNKNTFLIFLFSILFFSCGKNTNIKSVAILKKNIVANPKPFNLADSLTFKALYDSSNKILIPKFSRFSRDSSYLFYVDAANRIAANYRKLGNYDSAFTYVSRSLEISDKHLDSVNLSTAQSYYLLGLMYRDFNKNEDALKYLNKSLKIRQNILSANDPLIGDIYNNLGTVFNKKNYYGKALKYFKKALQLRKARGFFDKSVGSTYMNLGNVYSDIGKYEISIEYYDTAMTIQKKILGNNHPFIAMILLNQANSFDEIGLLDSAIICDMKALKIFKKTFGEYHPYIAHLYNNLGLYHSSSGDYQNAINFYLKSIDVKEKLHADFRKEFYDNYANLGEAYRMLGNYNASINALQKALKIIASSKKINVWHKSNIKSKMALTYLDAGKNSLALKTELEAISELEQDTAMDSLSIYKTKIFLSQILNKMGKFDKSIINSKECVNYFTNKNNLNWTVYSYELLAEAFSKKYKYLEVLNVYENIQSLFPDSSNQWELDLNKVNSYSNVNSIITETISFVGEAYLGLFYQTKKPVYLNKAENVYRIIIKLFAKNYGNKVIEISKIKETAKIKTFIQTGLIAAYKNFTLSPTQAHFEYALDLAEFGKSLTVLESLGEKSALKMSKIPIEFEKKMDELQTAIHYFVKQLSSENATEISDKAKKNFMDRLFKARFEYNELKNSLEKKYPVYKALTQIALNTSLSNIRASILDSDQSAIEYSLGKNKLYTFVISGDNFYILEKNLSDNFEMEINNLLESIKNNKYNNYIRAATNIYNIIFGNVDSLITTKRIMIINDGILGYIPYDALLYAKPKKNESYKNLPYLIKKYSIGYAYSFSILGKSKKGNNIISKFLGIAPFSK